MIENIASIDIIVLIHYKMAKKKPTRGFHLISSSLAAERLNEIQKAGFLILDNLIHILTV
ncbi:hypothetical protein KIS4809_3436 [Bacillus sp. ZZV12-4809]|nr:hypothetical protein KIS4809_3436 [Bacillus sp. ZZV12-4809]